jgi:hypothetical protein
MGRVTGSRFSRLALVFAAVLAFGVAALGTGLALGSGNAGTNGGPSNEAQPLSAVQASAADALPLFAFYYIWFSPGSWTRAKIDYPLLGDYSSSDAAVLRQQIVWAKSAGIQGWIVSWKDTALNDSRLKLLMQVAAQQDFKLAMIYQGLDFKRDPLPESEVAKDFQTFETQYAPNPVFTKIDGKALTIWSGTWSYTPAQVQAVTTPVRSKLLVLGTQKSVASYDQIARYTDGDAYYWSSVNPQTDNGYAAKLKAMAAAVHGDGGYWIAPFAPGFDAKLVGGTGTVPRDDGQTLRSEYAAALASSPDMLGLISWNEFSENSYIEPSKEYGHFYLDAVAALRDANVPVGQLDQDSSSSGGVSDGHLPDGLVLAGLAGLFVGLVGLLIALRPIPFPREHR